MNNKTKFRVGDRVIHKSFKVLGVVAEVDITKTWLPYKIGAKDSHIWATEDDLELIQPETQEPVVEEPIPGKYYRTRDGRKLKFLLKGLKRYIYETEEGCVWTYDIHSRGSINFKNEEIVGEWKEEVVLPAVEVKGYARVQIIERHVWKRGDVMEIYKSKSSARMDLKSDEEIVELVGILPERKGTE